MKALVISGGGSKGAFAGGVAEYLMKNKSSDYDIFIGTSTGSLLIPHLALNNIDKIKSIYTNVNSQEIFDINPFRIKNLNGENVISIHHFNVFRQFLRRKRTFGESHRLLKYIKNNFSTVEFEKLRTTNKEVIIHLDASVDTNDLQDFLNYARYKELTSKFKVSQKEVDQLANELNKDWWSKNRKRLIK